MESTKELIYTQVRQFKKKEVVIRIDGLEEPEESLFLLGFFLFRGFVLFTDQLQSCFLQFRFLLITHHRITQTQLTKLFLYNCGDSKTGIALIIRWDNVPGRIVFRSLRHGIFIRALVVIPGTTLL